MLTHFTADPTPSPSWLLAHRLVIELFCLSEAMLTTLFPPL